VIRQRRVLQLILINLSSYNWIRHRLCLACSIPGSDDLQLSAWWLDVGKPKHTVSKDYTHADEEQVGALEGKIGA
jgi:hypothetical protein